MGKYYLNRRSLVVTNQPDSHSVQVPAVVLLLLAPLLGGLFVFFVPTFIFVMLPYYLMKLLYLNIKEWTGATTVALFRRE